MLSAFNSKIRSFFLTLFAVEVRAKRVTIIFASSLNIDYQPLEGPIFVKRQTGNTSVAFKKNSLKKWIFYNNQLMSNLEHAYPHVRFYANASLIIYEQYSWMFYVRINILISHISILSMNSYDNPSSRPIWNHYDFFDQNGKQIQFDVLTKKANFSSACRIDLSCVKSTNSLVFSCSVAHQCMFKASLIIPQCIDKVLCCHSPLIFGNYRGWKMLN